MAEKVEVRIVNKCRIRLLFGSQSVELSRGQAEWLMKKLDEILNDVVYCPICGERVHKDAWFGHVTCHVEKSGYFRVEKMDGFTIYVDRWGRRYVGPMAAFKALVEMVQNRNECVVCVPYNGEFKPVGTHRVPMWLAQLLWEYGAVYIQRV